MEKLVIFTKSDLKSLVNKRPDESKFGEHVKLISNVQGIYEQLQTLDVQYVIFGIPEDIGVFANYGKTGTYNAWGATIKFLLNTQNSTFNNAKKVAVLGYLDFSTEQEAIKRLDQNRSKDIKTAREIVTKIDTYVAKIVHDIVKAGKIPIIIGGGHNNAYGNLKGTSLALNKPINAINFDAHTDFRNEEGRHSGNGFSYAFSEGFLKNYFVFGLHENYTSQSIFDKIKKEKTIRYNTYEALEIRKELKFSSEMNKALGFINDKPFGIEIDCDAIENISSSAQTPSGFSVSKARQFVSYFAKDDNAAYLHICEASPKKNNESKIGKLITYLITDFIRAKS